MTNDGLTWSGIGCFIVGPVGPICQQWVSKGDGGVVAVGSRLHAGQTVPVNSWPTRSIKAWTTVYEIVRLSSQLTRPSVATDSRSLERTATAGLIR